MASLATSIPSRVLVVGAGAIGLRTALEICRRNVPVVLRAPQHPAKESCSAGAGGFWMPFHCEDPRVDRWSIETLHELLEISDQKKQHEGENLVEVLAALKLMRENLSPNLQELIQMDDKNPNSGAKFPLWTQDPRLNFQHLTVEMLHWQNNVHSLRIPTEKELKDAGYLYAWFWNSPIVNAPAMLRYFIHELVDVHGMDVDVETGQSYESLSHLQADASDLGCDMVVNCTGMGSRELVNDSKLVPARGALLKYDRTTCVRRDPVARAGKHDAVITCEEPPWGNEKYPAYMIPRSSTLVVGGTYLEGDEEPKVRENERLQILQNAHWLGIDTEQSKPNGEWVGFRPVRAPTRCEFDTSEDVASAKLPIFHSYGHGGSGWTVNVGAAKECANQILKQNPIK